MGLSYEKRKQQVLNYLSQNGRLSTSEIQEIFAISPASVRRLCSAMESDGSVIRVRGGIRISADQQQAPQYSFESKSREFSNEKLRIAEAAVRMIKDGQCVFLESGSTVYQCAISLAEKISSGQLKNIRIFTNCINNLNVLSPVVTVNLIGGQYRVERQDFVGHLTERFIKGLYFDNAILGIDSVNEKGGLMAMDFDTALIDECLIDQSNHVTIVSDSGKFGKNNLVSFATLDDVNTVITDTNLSKEDYKLYSKYSAEIIRV